MFWKGFFVISYCIARMVPRDFLLYNMPVPLNHYYVTSKHSTQVPVPDANEERSKGWHLINKHNW